MHDGQRRRPAARRNVLVFTTDEPGDPTHVDSTTGVQASRRACDPGRTGTVGGPATDDASQLTSSERAAYALSSAVAVWLLDDGRRASTPSQQAALEGYVASRRRLRRRPSRLGRRGAHRLTPWYGDARRRLLRADHPAPQVATMRGRGSTTTSVNAPPVRDAATRTDEWYDLPRRPAGDACTRSDEPLRGDVRRWRRWSRPPDHAGAGSYERRASRGTPRSGTPRTSYADPSVRVALLLGGSPDRRRRRAGRVLARRPASPIDRTRRAACRGRMVDYVVAPTAPAAMTAHRRPRLRLGPCGASSSSSIAVGDDVDDAAREPNGRLVCAEDARHVGVDRQPAT